MDSQASALDEIAFLANTENRVAVLQALAEASQTRQELLERLELSRVTLARILRDFEARQWATRTHQTYALTPLGTWVADEFAGLLEIIEAEHRLRDVIGWLPTDHVTLDIQSLADAEIVYATPSNPTAPIRRAEEQLRGGTRLWILSTQVAASFFDIVEDGVVHGDTTVAGVATPSVYETIRNDTTMLAAFQAMATTDAATFYVSEDVPVILHIVDEEVLLGLTDDQAMPRAAVLSTDDAVYEWAVETFKTHRSQAKPVDPEMIVA